MESYIPYLISLTVLLISFLLYIFTRKSRHVNLPPGSTGWPLAGENIEFILSGPQKFVFERITKFSPELFRTSLWGEKLAVLCGPQGNKFLFLNENKLVTAWWPLSMRKALMFPKYAVMAIKEVAMAKRIIVLEFLKPEFLKSYIPIMDAMAREHMENDWAPNSDEVKVYYMSKKYTFALACRIFMSLKDPKRVAKLSKPFNDVIGGLFSVPIDLPGFAYNRAIKGGAKIREELLSIITEKREELNKNKDGTGEDLLSKLLYQMRDVDGYVASVETCNSIIGLLVASYDTTSAAVTFVIKFLAELPHIYDLVYKEQMEIKKGKAPGELLNWDDIQKMKYSWNVASESLRLVPPLIGSFQEATTDFTYAGFTIPKGWKTFWTSHTTHKNPKYFPNPEEFDPTRFEGNGPQPYTYVPFGGGPRMCPGKEYARLEILVFIHNVVTKFKLEKLCPEEKIIIHAAATASKGVPVRLIPHEN